MYVLIKWVKENQVSVGLDKYVKDKKMLKDPKRIGLVEHGALGVKPPKSGWKAFLAQILSVKESLGAIRREECQWIETHKMWTPSKPKATKDTEENSHSDDEDETPQYQKTDDKDDMIEELKLRVKDKEKEIRRLRRLNLQLQEGLADTITQTVKDAIQATKPVPSHQAPLPNQSAEIKVIVSLLLPTSYLHYIKWKHCCSKQQACH
ncbi:uncharacterized protein LOC123965108 isoform X2 [Micropterus dolomieu]|uniref:uncharacterized protein LOC123965108 isoform X2 n=1 Tax=Micropterus dolomieu TaxID=147949 RepID=UPI001E8CEDA8|nr:uncharacterized protein LOC123965108 isoform X2 [Micropterus dolomieu]